jgi:hypothetical protein
VGDRAVYKRPSLPRAWIAHRTRTVADGEAAWQAIHDPTFDPASEAVLRVCAARRERRQRVVQVTRGD